MMLLSNFEPTLRFIGCFAESNLVEGKSIQFMMSGEQNPLEGKITQLEMSCEPYPKEESSIQLEMSGKENPAGVKHFSLGCSAAKPQVWNPPTLNNPARGDTHRSINACLI